MHRQIVKGEHFGLDMDAEVYRYLICCRRCSDWWKIDSGPYGECGKGHGRKAGQTLSCADFTADFDNWTHILCETERLNGEMTKMVLGGETYYLDAKELAEVREVLGIKPTSG
jgi:hypothetical protein